MKRNMGRKELVRGENLCSCGGRSRTLYSPERCFAVPCEVSAELLTLVPAKNKGGSEKPDYKVAIIKPFISVLRMMRIKVIGCIVLLKKKKKS